MKFSIAPLVLVLSLCSCKSQTLSSVIDAVEQQVNGSTTPTSAEISRGLKEALSLSIEKGARSLSKKNAYFSDEVIKILLPEEARGVVSTLNRLGFSSLTEKLILKLNRAAEDAALSSVPIFKDAILSLNFSDSMKILTSKNSNAATDFLKQKTSNQLKSLYESNIKNSLNKVGADEVWTQVFSTYNRLPGLNKVNPSLSDYATTKALDGLFYTVSKREAILRSNLSERTSPLLQRIFGYADTLK